jgi:hypothetical protein
MLREMLLRGPAFDSSTSLSGQSGILYMGTITLSSHSFEEGEESRKSKEIALYYIPVENQRSHDQCPWQTHRAEEV